jgi:hypothetical protein
MSDAATENGNMDDKGTKTSKYTYHTMIIGSGMLVLAIVSIATIWKFGVTPNSKVYQFSVHAYQGDHQKITLTGPFLGKIRVDGTSVEITNSVKPNNKQSYCDYSGNTIFNSLPLDKKNQMKDACNVMRIPTMYSGNIRSSWSVLGAQSVSIVIKNISLISSVFSLFIFSDFYIRWMCEGHPNWIRWIRTVIVILAFIVSIIAIGLDFKSQMHTIQNGNQLYAIGSVSTGLFFWVITLLIICFSQIDDVKNYDWEKHTNLNMSFLILLLLPLFMMLGLLDHEKAVVDVHIQLIFFSSIFFAVLDIFQMRVMPVLEELSIEQCNVSDTDTTKVTQYLWYIKVFVVLACILCKLFVFVPTLELVGRYYVKANDSFSYAMLAFQIALLVSTSLIDLVHIVWWRDKSVYYVARTLIVWIIIVGSLIAIWPFPVITQI